MDYQNITNEMHNKPKRLNKKIIIILVAVIAIAIIITLIISLSSVHSTPNKQQLQEDLIQQKLNDENLSISDFTVYSEEEIDNKYTAIASVTYEKDNVEYNEKYSLTYSKYDDWEFYDVEAYDKNLWTKKPTALPNVDEYTELCLNEIEYNSHYEYDSFVFNESKSNSDLESGKATYAFDVKKETAIKKMSGEIDFSIEFDFDRGTWNIEKYIFSDSYELEYNFLHSWSGTLECDTQFDLYDKDVKKSQFSITEFEKEDNEGTIKGQFIFGDKTYDMSGSISTCDAYNTNDVYGIEMLGSNDKVCRLNGTLDLEGSLHIQINRDYTGGDGSTFYLYHPYDIFSGDLTLQ